MVPYKLDNELMFPWMQGIQGQHGYWYMASPYTKDPEGPKAAAAKAAQGAAWLMARGVHVFAPIPHSDPIADYMDETLRFSHEFWLGLDLPLWYNSCGLIVLMLPGWDESRGVTKERGWNTQANRLEVQVPWPLPTL